MRLFYRIGGSLLILIAAFVVAKLILNPLPGQAPSILYLFSPIFFGHFTPLLFIARKSTWDPLPAWLRCGVDRTVQGCLLIFLGSLLLFAVRYCLYEVEIWRDLELRTEGKDLPIFAQYEFFVAIPIIIVGSIVGDIVSHRVAYTLRSPSARWLVANVGWHLDNFIGGLVGFALGCFLLGMSPSAGWFDWLLSLVFYMFFHMVIDKVVHWNRVIGLKHYASGGKN
jgi:hypothetical protein